MKTKRLSGHARAVLAGRYSHRRDRDERVELELVNPRLAALDARIALFRTKGLET